MPVYNREKQELYEEVQFGRKQLLFLYNTVPGRILLRFFISKAYSRHSAKANGKRQSVKKIAPFVDTYHIEMSDYADQKYGSFNDFFIRAFKEGRRPVSPGDNDLVAVADSKLLAYGIDEGLRIQMKNSVYTVAELTRDENLAKEYQDGVCLVFRLSVDDCHRYIYVDSGRLVESKEIDGVLHTVTHIATKKHKVFSENYRVCSLLSTDHFDEVVQLEIGALLVGRVNNHDVTVFEKGQEKGFFEFGGSTIVLLFKRDTVCVDQDILDCSVSGIETKVKAGEKIGVRSC